MTRTGGPGHAVVPGGPLALPRSVHGALASGPVRLVTLKPGGSSLGGH